MEQGTKVAIISGFSHLSNYELYDHFRTISLSKDYTFLYAIINGLRSVARYHRYMRSAGGDIVLDVDVGICNKRCAFILQFAAMNGHISTVGLHGEKLKFLSMICEHKSIYVYDDPEDHIINPNMFQSLTLQHPARGRGWIKPLPQP
jgi:hypothetical protein